MKFKSTLLKAVFAVLALTLFTACQPPKATKGPEDLILQNVTALYAYGAEEYNVSFKSVYRFKGNLEEVRKWPEYEKEYIAKSQIPGTLKFLFGPLTHREIAGIQKAGSVTMSLDAAKQVGELVEVPYTHQGVWLVNKKKVTGATIIVPVPYNASDLLTPNWNNCTEAAHANDEGFFWYFWDPTRPACDSQLNVHYQMVTVTLGAKNPMQNLSYPEYSRMLRMVDGKKTFKATFAYGYVDDLPSPNPAMDFDQGADQYRRMVALARQMFGPTFKEEPINLKDYPNMENFDLRIGSKFVGVKDGIQVEFKVVVNANIDQMVLFAKSFAHDQDGAFAWFGHSRVGSGFDAQNFKYIVQDNPGFYQPTTDYQMIYWGGCNSYSYYTNPFFKFKADLDPVNDPKGTRNLDIISNAMPSYFHMYSHYSSILLSALISFKKPISYQEIIKAIELKSSLKPLLINVLGDEDNAKP